jgi:hypothetical protein
MTFTETDFIPPITKLAKVQMKEIKVNRSGINRLYGYEYAMKIE